MIATGETQMARWLILVAVLPNLWQENREGRRLIKLMSKVANGVTKGKRRGQCISGSYQNYQHVAVRNQLTDGGRGVEVCWGIK
jgi:hypothetical protein